MRKLAGWRAIIALSAFGLFLGFGIAGCGDDEEGQISDAGQDAAVDAAMDAAMDAAPVVTDAGKDSGPSIDANICPGPYQIKCGSTQCEDIGIYAAWVTYTAWSVYSLMCFQPCCTKTDNKCGAAFNPVAGAKGTCYELHQEGSNNAKCPSEMFGWWQVPGCCRPDGRCGLNADGIGLGCVAREEVLFITPTLTEIACVPEADSGT